MIITPLATAPVHSNENFPLLSRRVVNYYRYNCDIYATAIFSLLFNVYLLYNFLFVSCSILLYPYNARILARGLATFILEFWRPGGFPHGSLEDRSGIL